jgi:hypothetical protein
MNIFYIIGVEVVILFVAGFCKDNLSTSGS